MNEFAPQAPKYPEESEGDVDERIERYMDLMGVSVDEARRHLGFDSDDDAPPKRLWESKNNHPSNYYQQVDYTPRRSNTGPNYGEEDPRPLYYRTGDVSLSLEQQAINSRGAEAARAELRILRTDSDDAYQRAARDRARDERRWNKA